METRDLAALTTSQIAALTTDQIQSGLTTDQIAALTTGQIAALTTDQVQSGLTTDQIVALTTAQAGAFTTDQIAALTTDQIASLETQDFAALTTTQIAALTTDQIQSGLTTDQIVALTTAQAKALTTDQIGGASACTIPRKKHTSPECSPRSSPLAPKGLLFRGDPAIGGNVVPSEYKLFAPRIGFAYQVTPNTVIRAAYGLFYDEFETILFNTAIQGMPWTSQASLVGPLQFSNPYAGMDIMDPVNFTPSPTRPFGSYLNFQLADHQLRPAYVQSWNIVVERQLRSDLLLRIAYVANKGTDLLNQRQMNPGLWAAGASASNINQRRPLANIGSLYEYQSHSNASYQSGQLTVQKRYSGGFSILGNYTWSKSLDDSSNPSGGSPGPDPWNHRNNIGPSDFDITCEN